MLRVKNSHGLAKRFRSAFFVFTLNVFLIPQFAHAGYFIPFNDLPIKQVFGSLNTDQIEQLRAIWDHRDFLPNEIGVTDPGIGHVFQNLQKDKLRIEFMDYFLFPENYNIQKFRPGDSVDVGILDALSSNPFEDKGVIWIYSEDGSLIIGAGNNPEFKHSILANYDAEILDFSPERKFQFVVEAIESPLGIPNKGIQAGGRLGIDFLASTADVLLNVTLTGHFKVSGPYMFNENVQEALTLLNKTIYSEHATLTSSRVFCIVPR